MPLTLLWILALAQAPAATEGTPLRVLTFNIRYDEPADGLDAWPLRRDAVAGLVRFHRPDVAGLQEVLAHQLDDLRERLPGYEAFGEGREGGRRGEHCTVLYRPDRLELLDQGTFWLSRTPDRPGPDWGASLSRICTWGSFRERVSGERLHLWNVHLDHRSQVAREESTKMLRERIAALPEDEPVVLLGDFNCTEDSQAYLHAVAAGEGALVDALYAAREPGYGSSGTFTGFGHGEVGGPRIDHAFVRGPLRVERHAVLADTRDGRTPSDHRPVLVDLRLGVPFEQPRLELRSGWRFRPDPEGGVEGLQGRSVDDGAWATLLTGEAWERQGHPDLDGVAWYRRTLTVPPSWTGASVHLTWAAVDDGFTLWIDEERVLELEDVAARTPGAVRLPADLLRPGAESLLAFRVVDRGGIGGIVDAPVALVTEGATSTHWAERFRAEVLLDDVGWTAGAEVSTFSFDVAEGEPGADYLDLTATPAGGAGGVEAWLVAPDGESFPAQRERSGALRLERPADRGGRWSVRVDDRRGGEASGRLRVVLRDA